MRLAYLLAAFTFAACADNPAPSQRDAARAFTAVSARLGAASQSVGRANLAGTTNVNAPCSLGGTVALDGSYDITDAGTSVDMQATFAACQEPDGTFDGSLQWTSVVDQTKVQAEMHGTLDFTTAQGSFSCTFDVTSIVEAGHVHYSGSICGYAAADLDI